MRAMLHRIDSDARALLALFALATGCSSSDTIVALNVEFKAPIAGLSTLQVTIAQPGLSPNVTSITPPTDPGDAGPKIRDKFFERITLPDGWAEVVATIQVDAKNAAGTTLETQKTSAQIVEAGAVAAFVTFGAPPPASDEDAGAKM